LPEKLTLTSNLTSSIVAIFTFVLTFIPTLAPTSLLTFTLILIIFMIPALALAEPISLFTPKIAAVLSPATYILTEP
jgi:hypothetical protein